LLIKKHVFCLLIIFFDQMWFDQTTFFVCLIKKQFFDQMCFDQKRLLFVVLIKCLFAHVFDQKLFFVYLINWCLCSNKCLLTKCFLCFITLLFDQMICWSTNMCFVLLIKCLFDQIGVWLKKRVSLCFLWNDLLFKCFCWSKHVFGCFDQMLLFLIIVKWCFDKMLNGCLLNVKRCGDKC
jgi:hypothetical protein